MTIDNEGVTLRVAEGGSPDGPTVLLLHGITSCPDSWDWLVPHQADTSALRVDFPGHGQSGRAPGTFTSRACLAGAVGVCEQLVDGPCVVVGHSLGGGTAAASLSSAPTWCSVWWWRIRRWRAAISSKATRCWRHSG